LVEQLAVEPGAHCGDRADGMALFGLTTAFLFSVLLNREPTQVNGRRRA
jgi:hypothetical protein